MKSFEYKATLHPADEFKEMVYFCSQEGTCSVEKIPSSQTERIEMLLNDHGRQGWELVQVTFGKDGILVFWKRIIKDQDVI